jgi:hypothetical protein
LTTGAENPKSNLKLGRGVRSQEEELEEDKNNIKSGKVTSK